MNVRPTESIADLLVSNLSLDLLMGIEEALQVGAERAFKSVEKMHEGHLPSAIGQMRHFNMNETFHDALLASSAIPTPIKGNTIVVGQSGIFALSRFNVSTQKWNNSRRSKSRRKLCLSNFQIEPLVQPSLFGDSSTISQGTAFFVSSFLDTSSKKPDSIDIVVPNVEMTQWLFNEPLSVFIKRYETEPVQMDGAQPVLKAGVGKILLDGTGQ